MFLQSIDTECANKSLRTRNVISEMSIQSPLRVSAFYTAKTQSDISTRPPQEVLADGREGFVSAEAAQRDYGVC